MSLMILKNTDPQAPNRFGNDFVNTITIHKNYEAALHSISFNRLDGYAANLFFTSTTAQNSISTARWSTFYKQKTMWPVQIALENGVYTIDELEAHI